MKLVGFNCNAIKKADHRRRGYEREKKKLLSWYIFMEYWKTTTFIFMILCKANRCCKPQYEIDQTLIIVLYRVTDPGVLGGSG